MKKRGEVAAVAAMLVILGWTNAPGAVAQVASPAAASAPAPAQPPELDLTAALLYQIVAAELALQRGDAGSAFATYLSVARQTRDARIARRATEIAISGRAGPQALEAATLWNELDPDSRDARQAHALLLVATGRLADAEPLFAAMLRESRQPAAELGQIQRAVARAEDRGAAYAMLERLATPLLKQQEIAADVQLTLAAGAHQAGLAGRAVEAARAALALRPDDQRIVLTAAQLLARPQGKDDAEGRTQALALLAETLNRQPAASDIRVTYARLLLADYFERYLKAVDSAPIATHDPDPAYLNLARIAEEERRFDEALQWLQRVGDGPQQFNARLRQAIVLAKMQRLDEARRLLAETPAADDEQRRQLAMAEGQALREGRRFDESYQVLSAALERSPEDTALLYDTAMAAERIDRIDAMETHLRRLMQLKPDDPHAYNALGYTFADRNTRLEEAYDLIDTALKLAPDDAHILDSMGWVHFRMGNLAKARGYLERAYALRQEAEIGAHLGEVLWALGDHEAARRIWRQVRAEEPENETLSATLARLQVRL